MGEPETAPEKADDIIFMVKADEASRRAAHEALRAAFPDGVPGKLRNERVVHATLVLAGSANEARTTSVALETAGLIRSSRFQLVFDTVTRFQGPNGVLALTCSMPPPEWTPLRKQLTQVPRRLGVPIEGGSTPHLTMAYGCPLLSAARLAEPVVWSVDEFLLVRSLHGQADHELLGQWTLQ